MTPSLRPGWFLPAVVVLLSFLALISGSYLGRPDARVAVTPVGKVLATVDTELGFLAMHQARPSNGDVFAVAQAKIEEIDTKIRELQGIRQALARLASTCPARGPLSECPILDELASQEEGG